MLFTFKKIDYFRSDLSEDTFFNTDQIVRAIPFDDELANEYHLNVLFATQDPDTPDKPLEVDFVFENIDDRDEAMGFLKREMRVQEI